MSENDVNIQAGENTDTNTTITNTTELNVAPSVINLKVGETKIVSINTNALDFTMESSNPNVIGVNKFKKQIVGIGKGDAQVTITAQVNGEELLTEIITCHITQNLGLDFGSEAEILENTHHYDETLPLSVNGTIAYKRGDNDFDPLIKLVFDGRLQRWQVIGIKITKWNSDNEPYSLYFMASEGAVADKLNTMNLERVIVDMVDRLFIQETPNMSRTIQDLFHNEINPLIEAECAKIPQYIQNEITHEIDQKIEDKMERVLDEKFTELVEKRVEEKIKEFSFSRIEPYHKKRDLPKWVGVIMANTPKMNGKLEQEQFISRRINTNGIEEHWIANNHIRINDFGNDDELTKLFDSIEPFRSMDRMEIMYSDLKNIAGDSIYSKEIFERLMSQSLDKNHKLWTGSFYGGDLTEINRRESLWFVPLKKCHYIDVEFALDDTNKNRYILKAVGEKEFTIDLKNYFPNITSIKIVNANVSESCGWKQFYVNGTEITSVVHPAFLNYYDPQCNILSEPIELDYVYVGAFLDVMCPVSENFNGVSQHNFFLGSKPFANVYSNGLNFKRQQNEYVKYMFGMNPSVGVNLKSMEFSYAQLLDLLIFIERGDILCTSKQGLYSERYKWANNYIQKSYFNGYTWHLGNKTGSVKTNIFESNYRGIENFRKINEYIEGIWKETNNQIYLHKPHTHRYKPRLFEKDGIHYIASNIKFLNDLQQEWNALSLPNRYLTYNKNAERNNDKKLLYSLDYFFGGSDGVWWMHASRSCI